jgi:hypothetical protein
MGTQNMPKTTIPKHFLGFLKFLEEEKGPQITNMEKFIYSTFYLLNNLDNFVLRKFFPFFLYLGDSQFC